MGKVVTFSLDSRSDRRGEHPIRLYVRSCDGHRFQSTVGYNVPSERWDSGKQRAIVDMESDSATNCKGIPFSEINERIEAISKAFEALLSVPGAATKLALASALDQVTSKSLDNAILGNAFATDRGQITSGTESPNEDDLAIIREFLSSFHDFASKDRRKGYVNVYRPEWHAREVSFIIHLPKRRRSFVHSGAIMMKGDGSIWVQGSDYHEWQMSYGYTGKTYELSKCFDSDINHLVASIKEYQIMEESYMPDDSAKDEIIPSIVIPTGNKGVGSGAFDGHTELKAVSIPDGIVVIGDSAFAGCCGLEEIHLPDSVIEIGDSAFKGCAGLKSVYISNVVEIGKSAFEGCVGLMELHIPGSVTKIGGLAFKGCLSLKELSVPNGLDLSKSGLSGEVRIIVRNSI